MSVKEPLRLEKAEVMEMMLSHFPVQKVTPFGLVGSYCLCGVHLGPAFTFSEHVVALLEGDTDVVA